MSGTKEGIGNGRIGEKGKKILRNSAERNKEKMVNRRKGIWRAIQTGIEDFSQEWTRVD